MQIIYFIFCLFFTLININSATFAASSSAAIEALNRSRVAHLDIECVSFCGTVKTLPVNVLDTVQEDVVQIFSELKRREFPIYAISCFAPRNIRSGGVISLHAYAAAIDLNYIMNPHYDVLHPEGIIPGRSRNREEDIAGIIADLESIRISKQEIASILETVIQPEGSDDWFLNRGIIRKGMITPDIAELFKLHGFNVWGGMWREPMDFMHFQLPRSLAEQLAVDDSQKTSGQRTNRELWEEHKAKILNPTPTH